MGTARRRSANTDENSAIEYFLMPSLMEMPVSLSATCHSTAIAKASFAVSASAVSV